MALIQSFSLPGLVGLLFLATFALLRPTGAASSSSSSTEMLSTFLIAHEAEELKAEAQAIKLLEKVEVIGRKEDATAIIAAAFERGWMLFAKRAISLASASNHDVSHIVHSSAQSMRQKLTALVDHAHTAAALASSSSSSSTSTSGSTGSSTIPSGISPAFEFAQSHEIVALNVKFSHKLDAPGALGCKASRPADFYFPSNSSLIFKANCATKTFVLSLTLHDEVDPQSSSFELTSVGRATITLRKKTIGVWPRLQAKEGAKKQHQWWQMQERLDKEIEAWEKAEKERKEKEKKEKEAAAAAAAAAANATAGAEGGGAGSTTMTELTSGEVSLDAAGEQTTQQQPEAAAQAGDEANSSNDGSSAAATASS